MERKNIFSILAEKNSLSDDINRILLLMKHYGYATDNYNEYTLKEMVEDTFFLSWKGRGRCINLDDYYATIGFKDILASACLGSINDAISVIEVIYNFSNLVDRLVLKTDDYELMNGASRLRQLMDDVLSDYNQKAYYDEEQELVYIVEDKPEVTAVAEIVEVVLAADIIRYNHRTLKGNVGTKKAILLAMGAELEPKRKQISNDLADQIFLMLNNMNLRHNNINERDKNYREYVAKMPEDEMEEWYDELYQMIILAFLEIDQQERNTKVNELKKKILSFN